MMRSSRCELHQDVAFKRAGIWSRRREREEMIVYGEMRRDGKDENGGDNRKRTKNGTWPSIKATRKVSCNTMESNRQKACELAVKCEH